MTTPRLLDLFACGGGCSRGYQRAGFHVTAVDRKAHPKNPADVFVVADALEYVRDHGHEFDAIHASPPCQRFSTLKHFAGAHHEDLIEPTRAALVASGKPWIMENVPGSPLNAAVMLCGTMFRLATPCGAELRRHRYFEINWSLGFMIPPCEHGWGSRVCSVSGCHPCDPSVYRMEARSGRRTLIVVGGDARVDKTPYYKKRIISITGVTPQRQIEHNALRETFSVDDARIAMGIDWDMPMRELSQAIPPPVYGVFGSGAA